jgi:hypothetical protein
MNLLERIAENVIQINASFEYQAKIVPVRKWLSMVGPKIKRNMITEWRRPPLHLQKLPHFIHWCYDEFWRFDNKKFVRNRPISFLMPICLPA